MTTKTEIDLLNNKIIAQTVVRLIRDDPERPITVGVHGDWGAGKSSVLLMIERDLDAIEDVLCLRFNGWLFQGFEDAKVVLIEQIVQGVLDARSDTAKVRDAAKKLLKRIDWLRAAKKLGGLAFTAFTGVPSPELLADLGNLISKVQSDPSGAMSEFNLSELGAQVSSLVGEPEGKHLPQEIHAFRDEFRELIEATGVGQLIVLIDDLDRCLPKAAVETLEALRLFLWMPKTAFVIAADEAMIEYAVREHFPDLPASAGPLTYAVSRHGLVLLQLQLFVIYWQTLWLKLADEHWRNGEFVAYFQLSMYSRAPLEFWAHAEILSSLLTFGTLLVEFLLPLLLISRRTRMIGFAVGFGFHFGVLALSKIWLFSLAICIPYFAFLESDDVTRLERLGARIRRRA